MIIWYGVFAMTFGLVIGFYAGRGWPRVEKWSPPMSAPSTLPCEPKWYTDYKLGNRNEVTDQREREST